MTPHPIIKALEEYEAAANAAAVAALSFFAWREPWLARQLWLQGCVPGYSHADFLRNVLSRLSCRGQKIASRAAAVQLKHDMTRLRAFYPDKAGGGYCVKIVQADGVTGSRMREELKLRGRLAALGTVTIPAMRETFERGNYIYLIEDIIIGRRFDFRRDADDYIARGLPQMVATYNKAGITFEPLSAHFDAALLARLSGIKNMAPDFVAALDAAFANNPAVPVSLCHGDLLPSNLCIGKDAFYLLDWDRSFTGAIARDLLRLPMKYPAQGGRVGAAVMAVLRTASGGDAAAADAQLAAYVAQRIADAPEKALIYQSFWRRCRLA